MSRLWTTARRKEISLTGLPLVAILAFVAVQIGCVLGKRKAERSSRVCESVTLNRRSETPTALPSVSWFISVFIHSSHCRHFPNRSLPSWLRFRRLRVSCSLPRLLPFCLSISHNHAYKGRTHTRDLSSTCGHPRQWLCHECRDGPKDLRSLA